jgi:hypothetical protein
MATVATLALTAHGLAKASGRAMMTILGVSPPEPLGPAILFLHVVEIANVRVSSDDRVYAIAIVLGLPPVRQGRYEVLDAVDLCVFGLRGTTDYAGRVCICWVRLVEVDVVIVGHGAVVALIHALPAVAAERTAFAVALPAPVLLWTVAFLNVGFLNLLGEVDRPLGGSSLCIGRNCAGFLGRRKGAGLGQGIGQDGRRCV